MAIPNDKVIFSILILSIPSRLQNLSSLMNKLHLQIGERPVEVLCLVDNKSMTIGEKRNKLLHCARGTHLAFLDDDDNVAEDYVSSIVDALIQNPMTDVVAFKQHCTVNGKTFYVDFDLSNPNEPARFDSAGNFVNIRRKPYHMCVWKSAIAKNTPFSDISYGEDLEWISKLALRSRSQTKLDKVLHYYQYSDSTSESIQFRGNNG